MKTRHLLLPLWLLAACGGDTTPNDETPGNNANHDNNHGAPSAVTVTDMGSGVHRLVIDASDESAWVSVDLGLPGAAAGAWDLQASRFRIRTNGGVSGDAGMAAAPLAGASFASVSRAPVDGWVEDAPKEGADPETPDFVPDSDIVGAFEQPNEVSETGWYDYDPATHVLSPADLTYAVRGRDGAYFALRFLDYYDDAGTPGFVTLDVKPIDPPEGDPAPTLEALDTNDKKHVTVGGAFVDGSDGLGWDLAIERTWMTTNSGLSGEGVGGARWAPEGVAFADVTAAPTVGYVMDEMVPLPGPPGSGEAPGNPVLNAWYDYDPTTHALSPKQGVLLIRGADGDYAKLAIDSYEGGVYALRLEAIDAAPEAMTAEIALAETFTLVDLATGVVTDGVTDPSAEPAWDLAISQTRALTRRGAAPLEDFAGATAPPAEGYVADEGDGEARAHAALTAALTTGAAFCVPVGEDLGHAKIEVTPGASGPTLEWVYTGPKRETFQ